MASLTIAIVFALLIAVFSQRNCEIKDKSDPCNRYNTRDIPYQDSRHPSVPYSDKTDDVNKYCDLYALDNGVWYISDYNITQSCVQQESCGSRLPIWLNGTIPKAEEGAVNRSACLRTYDGCCKKTYTLMVKNCMYYNVYCFWNLPHDCPQRFCFDVDLSKVTTTTTSTTTSTTATSSIGTTPNTSESAEKGCRNEKCDNHVVIVALTLVASVSVSANALLTGYIIYSKKKSVTPAIPKRRQ